MTHPNETSLQQLRFYVTMPYACGYLSQHEAKSLIASPQHMVNAEVYSQLIRAGFRRSGKFVYRPHCDHCQACVPVRIPVAELKPDRSQRRAWKQHRQLAVNILPLQDSEEHYALYRAYQHARHHNGGVDQDSHAQYRNFLTESNVDTILVEFREDGLLRMVSVVDRVDDGISAVYTFYDCSNPKCAYGTFNVLWLTDWCRHLGLPYLYLGYWIAESNKMAYKKNFAPIEGLINGRWTALK
jgi:arginyl-tRNA--protein-N-Asp/Glu arginylyltransferase